MKEVMHYTSIHIFSRYINSTLTLKINKQLMCKILLTIASTICMLQLQEVRYHILDLKIFWIIFNW